MANAFVATGAKAFADGGINWLSDTIKAILADASFTPTYDSNGNINNAQFLSDVSSSQVGSPSTISGKTSTAGILGASDLSFSGVSGNTVVRIWVYKDTGTPSTSQLILAYDSASGLPLDPIGGIVTVAWDTGVTTGVAGVAQI